MACYPEYAEVAKSVVLIMIDGSALGTGTLVNNTAEDGKPYILTATHVISRNFKEEDPAAFSSRFLYIFGFQSPMCDGSIKPSYANSIAGSTLMAYHPYTDVGLVQLSQTPPIEYPSYYSGWCATPSLQDTYFNIHHPNGNSKRVNLLVDKLTIGSFPATTDFKTGIVFPFGKNQHLIVSSWTVGTTAPGSSGSPLFNSQQQVLGVLTGGTSYCNSKGADQFGSLLKVWESSDPEARKLVELLDPSGKGRTTTCRGRSGRGSNQPAPTRITHMAIPPSSKPVMELLPQLERVQLLGEGHGAKALAEVYQVKAGSKVYGAYLMLSGSAYASDQLQVHFYLDGATTPHKSISIPLTELTNASGERTSIPWNPKQWKELYVSLPEPLSIESEQSLAIGVTTQQLPSKVSIAHQQHEGQALGSAHWLIGNKWEPATTGRKKGSFSLWIDPLLSHPQLNQQAAIVGRIRLTPLSSETMLLTITESPTEGLRSLNIYTMQGQRLYSYSQKGNLILIPRKHLEGMGIVILQVQTPDWHESIKAYFPKN